MTNPATIADKLLEDDDVDPKEYAMQHVKVLPPILNTEDCELLTDRWGDAYGPSSAKTDRINRLARTYQYCFNTGYEDCFLVRRNGKLGILFEVEFVTPDSDPDMEDMWHGNVPADIGKALQLLASALQHKHPEAEWYVSFGSHIFNGRYAIRAFCEHPEDPKGIMRDMHQIL